MSPYTVYLWAMLTLLALCIIMPLVSAAEHRHKQRQAEERRAAKRADAERAKAIRQERQQAAQVAQGDTPKRKRGRPRKNPPPAADPEPEQPAAPAQDAGQEKPEAPAQRPEAIPARLAVVGNNAFAGECVAFTGTIPGMTRAEAICAVEENGGRAFDTMPACTTLLVVGDKPGTGKLDKADKWGVKKIAAETFTIRTIQPLTVTPNEFAALYTTWLNEQEV